MDVDIVDLTFTSPPKKKKCNFWVTSTFSKTKNTSMVKSSAPPQHSKISKDNSITWLEKYSPKSVEELAVHKKKIQEVESWIDENITNRKGKVLLISGPPGCGKSTTVELISLKYKIFIENWSNPLTTPYNITKQAGLKYESQVSLFEEFLFRSGKYPSLLVTNNSTTLHGKQIVLVREFPWFIQDDPSMLQSIIRKYTLTQTCPLIFIISDGRQSLKPQDFTTGISHIRFNAISATLMSKALTRITKAEKCSLRKEELSMLGSTGDIRAAINALQFSCVSGKDIKFRKSFANVGAQDSTLILFRALGKVFYCKREKSKNSTVDRDPITFSPEDIVDQCAISGSFLTQFLHHNYLTFFNNNSIEDITMASDYLSCTDILRSPLTSSDPSSGIRLDHYEGILGCRSLIYSNSLRATQDLCSKAKGQWRPMHKSEWPRVIKKHQENLVEGCSLFWVHRQPQRELLTSMLPYFLPLKLDLTSNKLNFLQRVISFSKWKAYNCHGDKIMEHESVNNSEMAFLNNPVMTNIKGGEIKEDTDEDIIIEEFDD